MISIVNRLLKNMIQDFLNNDNKHQIHKKVYLFKKRNFFLKEENIFYFKKAFSPIKIEEVYIYYLTFFKIECCKKIM